MDRVARCRDLVAAAPADREVGPDELEVLLAAQRRLRRAPSPRGLWSGVA